jgi:hypothetical protein
VRVDLLEKLVMAMVVLTVVGVGGGVGAMTVMFPGGIDSGVPDVAGRSDSSTDIWRQAWLESKGIIKREVNVPDAPLVKGAAPLTEEKKKEIGVKKTKGYFVKKQVQPQQRVFAEIPWLKKVPGVRYRRPRRISRFVYQKFQSFNDTWNAAQSGGGEFTKTKDGQSAYKINWVDPRSELASMVGLKPNDKVIAINGNPVGNSVNAGRAMYDQLKGQKKFAIMIERGGKTMVLPFYVP